MFTYVENNTHWEEWQKPYKFGVVLILPPSNILQPVSELRQRYDPLSAAICPPHISVSDPLGVAMTPTTENEISEQLRLIEPFELYFDEIISPNDSEGVCYTIMPQQPIDALKSALHSTSAFADVVFERRDIPAHMTIAEFLTPEDSKLLCRTLHNKVPKGSFVCKELVYLVPDDQFRFCPVLTFALGER